MYFPEKLLFHSREAGSAVIPTVACHRVVKLCRAGQIVSLIKFRLLNRSSLFFRCFGCLIEEQLCSVQSTMEDRK